MKPFEVDTPPFKGCYHLNKEVIESIVEKTREFLCEDPEVAVEFESRKLRTANLQAIFDDLYTKSERIRSLTIYGTNKNSDVRISIHPRLFRAVIVNIKGERDAVLKYEQAFSIIMKSAEAPYSRFKFALDALSVPWLICFVIGWIATFAGAIYLGNPNGTDLRKIMIVMGLFLISLLAAVVDNLCPRIVFMFGYGEKLYSSRSIIRTAAASFILITIGGGLFVNFFTDWLKSLP